MSTDVESLSHSVRQLHEQFERIVAPHRGPLWRYCCSLTGSIWDGEDLFQETLAKAFSALPQIWQPISPKAYLFRIATNAWTDDLRRRQIEIDHYTAIEHIPHDESPADPDQVRDAVTHLVDVLPPRQTAVLLLMDVFGFTAPEVAGMIHCTTGAVYAALHRARTGLRASQTVAGTGHRNHSNEPAAPQKELIDRLLQAVRTGDTQAMLALTSDQVHTDASPGFQEFSKKDTKQGSGQYVPSNRHVEFRTLWGRLVQIVLVQSERGPELHDISYQEWDNGQIVRHKSYYFCKELMLAAGEELGVPVQRQKPPGLNWEDQ